MTKHELWHSKRGFGSALLIACIDDFGLECVNWEPETLEITVREKYGDVDPDSVERLLAAIGVLTSNMFTQDVIALCMTCATLDFERTGKDSFVPAGLDEIMWGLTEARLLLGGLDDKEFSDEVCIYVGKLLADEGLENPPDTLSFAVKNNGGLDKDTLADLPDLSALFEEDQATSRRTLDMVAMEKLRMLLEQIDSLKLRTSDLAEFKEVFNRMKSVKQNA
jgi:hypothetical protein